MRNSLLFHPLYFPLIFFASCSGVAGSHNQEMANENATGKDTVFQRVIDHYGKTPSDSLKCKAAKYLIANIDGWSYYEGQLLDKYQDYVKLIRRDQDHGDYFMYSFNMLYGPFKLDELVKKLDRETVSSAEMIGNIDMAFSAWREQPWGKDIDFNRFCEYILPFRIDNEIPEYNRKAIYDQFDPVLDSIRKANGDAVVAGAVLNDALRSYKWIFSLRASFLPHFRSSQILKYRVGSCREMTDLAFYAMRATGIPVAIDFIPQWPYRSMGHEFNVLLDKNGKSVMFLGSEDNPGTPHKPGVKMGKVYRHTYTRNLLSLAMLKNDSDEIPHLFEDPRLKDVTDQYVPCLDIDLPLPVDEPMRKQQKFAYLSVFNNADWIPVAWGQIQGAHASFAKIEGDIVYMVCYYTGSRVVPIGDPLIPGKDGRLRYLRPDSTDMNTKMLLSAIFPVIPDDYNNWHMNGCKFQGADRPDFKDARDLYVIPQKPNPFWNEIILKNVMAFRYVRYMGTGYTHMGEMEFYDKNKKLNGKGLGTKTGWYGNKTFDKALDGDIFTSFDPAGANTDTCWVGLDLGKKEKISKIRFSAPLNENLQNKIIPGHQYELFYWGDEKWNSAGKQAAKTGTLLFDKIPSHALYILRDNNEKMEARIFTYEHNKQVWW